MTRQNTGIVPFGSIFPTVQKDFVSSNALELFDEFFDVAFGNKQKTRDLFKNRIEYPKTDAYIVKDEDKIVFEMSLPGIKKEELEVLYENDTLCVKSKKTEEKEEDKKEEKKYLIKELKHSSFMRSWALPSSELDLESREIESSLEDGILKVQVPLKPEEKPKRLEIQIK